MNRLTIYVTLGVLLYGIVPVWADESESPNVILVVTDDQGYGDMACYGNPWLATPNLDQLYADSVRLEDYHVDPVCTPTRAALMSGRYSTRVGAWAVTEGRQLLDPDEQTLANAFEESGYRTGMFGKWHLGDAWPYAPRFRGFQDVVCHRAGGIDEIGNPVGNDFFDDTYYRNGTPEQIDGYCTDVFFRECERFITQSSDQPFFAYLPLNAMHGPHTVAKKYYEPFLDSGHPENRAKFFGMIINFDENLGRMMDSLKERGLDRNTIVIFMGDNGSASGRAPDDFNAGMRGKKGSCYEGGHRVACFVRWPGKLDAGHEVQALTCCRDWFPTLIELCNLKPAKLPTFDGTSIAPLLMNQDSAWPARVMFVERQADQTELVTESRRRNRYPHYAVLSERWRLVDGELYEMTVDPGQQSNVAAKHPDVVRQLTTAYEDYYADVFSDGAAYTRFQVGSQEENPTRFTVRDWHPTDGNVIWKKEQLGDDQVVINGFWAINVVRAGKYAVRLSRFPDDAAAPMRAKKARLKIGEQEASKDIAPDDESVTFEVDLPEGQTLLQTWLTDDKQDVLRGAYYIEVERFDS
ncbi:MAG: arylsulfatase [Rubripirellula sp.]